MGQTLENSLNFTFSKPNTMCIVVFHSSAVAIGFSDGCYYVFDPHSRGQDGLFDPYGTCILSIATSLQSLCSFLRLLCLSLSNVDLTQVQFEVNVVSVNYQKPNTTRYPAEKIYIYPSQAFNTLYSCPRWKLDTVPDQDLPNSELGNENNITNIRIDNIQNTSEQWSHKKKKVT